MSAEDQVGSVNGKQGCQRRAFGEQVAYVIPHSACDGNRLCSEAVVAVGAHHAVFPGGWGCRAAAHIARMHAVEEDQFIEFKNHLSGLTADNIIAVQQMLVEMGLSLGPAAEVQLAAHVATSTAAVALVRPAPQPAASVASTGHTVVQQGAAGALRMEDAAMSQMHTLLGVVWSGTA